MSYVIKLQLVSDNCALIHLSRNSQTIYFKMDNFQQNKQSIRAILKDAPAEITQDINYQLSDKYDGRTFSQMAEDICLELTRENINLSDETRHSIEGMPVAFSHRHLDELREYWHGFTPYQLFQILSVDLLELPYADSKDDYLFHMGHYAFHTNHGTNHAIRQYILVTKFIDFLATSEHSTCKDIAANLTTEERACVELGAFLFRSGRTNEKGFSEDATYSKRSAEIFRHITSKLDFDEAIIQLVATSYNYHSPLELPVATAKYSKEELEAKAHFFRALLRFSHESDLVRCKTDCESLLKDIVTTLIPLLRAGTECELIAQSFLEYAASLCEATGAPVAASRFSSTKAFIIEKRVLTVKTSLAVISTINTLSAKFPSVYPTWQSPTKMWLESDEHTDATARAAGKVKLCAHDRSGANILITDAWTEEDLEILPIDACIESERALLSECITVYHSTTKTSRAIELLCKFLAADDEQAITWLRATKLYGKTVTAPSIGDIKHKSREAIDNGDYMSWNLLSCSPTLLHNADYDSQESSIDYFFSGTSVKKIDHRELIKGLLTKRGLLIGEEALREELYLEFEALISDEDYGTHGILYQFQIPHHLVNQVAYISGANGTLDTANPSALNTLIALKTPGANCPNQHTLQVRLLLPLMMQPEIAGEITVNVYTAMSTELEAKFERGIQAIADKALSGPTLASTAAPQDLLVEADEAEQVIQSFWRNTGAWSGKLPTNYTVTFYKPPPRSPQEEVKHSSDDLDSCPLFGDDDPFEEEEAEEVKHSSDDLDSCLLFGDDDPFEEEETEGAAAASDAPPNGDIDLLDEDRLPAGTHQDRKPKL